MSTKFGRNRATASKQRSIDDVLDYASRILYSSCDFLHRGIIRGIEWIFVCQFLLSIYPNRIFFLVVKFLNCCTFGKLMNIHTPKNVPILNLGNSFSHFPFHIQIIFKCINRRPNFDRIKIHHSTLIRKPHTKKLAKNVTPPPAYATLFNRSKIFTTEEYIKPFDTETGVKKVINGRQYMVYRNSDGEPRLVPIRTPSAALFQYAYTK